MAILSKGYTQNCQPQNWQLIANSEVGNLMLSQGHNWNMITSDYVLLYTPIIGKSLEIWNSLGRRRRPLWFLWRPFCGFWNFQGKIEKFGFLYTPPNVIISSYFRNFSVKDDLAQLWPKIGDEGDKILRKNVKICLLLSKL